MASPQDMTKGHLDVRTLDVAVGDRPLMAGVSFSLEPGEAVVLHGRSGLGKSTLLRVLAALHADPADRVRVDGRVVGEVGVPHWRRSCVYVGQSAVMLDGSVRDNLSRAFGYQGSEGKTFSEERAESILAAMLLPGVLDREAKELSGGEQQRVHVARALLLDPPVFLLDEPVAALDPDTREAVWAQLDARRMAGASLVIVTHEGGPSWATALDLEAYRV